MKTARRYSLAIAGFGLTLLLTLVSAFVPGLSNEVSFVVFATGAVVSLAVVLLRRDLEQDNTQLGDRLKMYGIIEPMTDDGLKRQVYDIIKQLSRGELSPSDFIESLKISGFMEQIAKQYSLTIACFGLTLLLTLVSAFVPGLSNEVSFVVFATGAVVSLAVTILRRDLEQDNTQLGDRLKMYGIIEPMTDDGLKRQVYDIIDQLSCGELSPLDFIESLKMYGILEQITDDGSKRQVYDIIKQLSRGELSPSDFIDSLKMYGIIEQITDDGLKRQAYNAIEHLSRGELSPFFVAGRSRKLVEKCVKSWKSSYVVAKIDDIYEWQDDSRQGNWFRGNQEAIKRTVKVERIFVVPREILVGANGRIDDRARNILIEQTNIGISVRILWLNDLESRPPQKNLVQTFDIFDDSEVVVTESRYSDRGYRSPSPNVEAYRAVFTEQKKSSIEFDPN